MITCAITGSNGVLGKKIKDKLPYKFYEFNKDIRNLKSVEEWVLKKDLLRRRSARRGIANCARQ